MFWTAPSHWYPPRRYWQLAMDASTRSWLLSQTSLTQRLIRHAHGDFSVRVIRQAWERPSPDEVRALGLKPCHVALIREVELLGQGQAWVRARSVLPLSALTGAGRRLRKLGNRSLGALLFRDPNLKRGPIDIACIRNETAHHFVRRSRLQYRGHNVLVAERFLPALLKPPR